MISLAVGNVKCWIFVPVCSFWPLCLQLGQGVMSIPGWRRTLGLLVGRATTGKESCPAQQVCLFLCNLLHFPSTLHAKVLLWDKVNCETSIFFPSDYYYVTCCFNSCSSMLSLWPSGLLYFQSLNQPLLCSYTCVHKPEPSFSSLRHADFKVGYCARRACMWHMEAWGRRCPSLS